MNTTDIFLASALESENSSSSKSMINKCCILNLDFSCTYDKNIYYDHVIPSKHLVILCCMDARLDIFRMLGLKPGEAHIIQNGGGRIRDAVRSLICSQQMFQTKELMIIHHTDCGFTYFSNNDQILNSLIVQSSPITTSTDVNIDNLFSRRALYQGDKPDFLPILDIEQSIRDDIVEYKQYPMLDQNIIIRGFLYDTKAGLLKEVK